MAAPTGMTAADISGKFVLNKEQSEKNDDLLKLQGVSWMMRKAAGMATPHLTIKHYSDATAIEHIEVEQVVAGKTIPQHHVLDASQKAVASELLGPLLQRNRRTAVEELEADVDEWLKTGWLPETFVDGKIIHVTVGPAGSETWRMHQTWGFRLVEGQKKYVRRIHCVGQKDEVVHGCLVYDYEGPL